MPERLRALILAPHLNRDGLGEVYSIFQWVAALSERVDLTVITLSHEDFLSAQLPGVRVISLREPKFLRRAARLNAVAKPWLPVFFRQARRWIKARCAEGDSWDVAHQMLPQAMRYPSPLSGLGLPYVVGPLGGALETPPGFQSEMTGNALVNRLRGLDRWRLRHDPWLRRGYEEADLVLGVAPYIEEILRDCNVRLKRFEPVLERAHDGTMHAVDRTSGPGEAHLLHVGRVIRTKGLRDVIRALGHLKDMPGVRLTSAGDGPDLDACRKEAQSLGIADKVTFLGRVPREHVDQLYATADVFCFPSFREPMGGVFFEAMEYSLPVIAADCGGPAFILDDASAIKLSVDTPADFAKAIADAVRALANDPGRRHTMGAAAAERLRSFGNWNDRAAHLERLYREILTRRA